MSFFHYQIIFNSPWKVKTKKLFPLKSCVIHISTIKKIKMCENMCQVLSIEYINHTLKNNHWFLKISQDFNYTYELNLLNYPQLWTLSSLLAKRCRTFCLHYTTCVAQQCGFHSIKKSPTTIITKSCLENLPKGCGFHSFFHKC